MHAESYTQEEIQADEIISDIDVMTCPGCKMEGPKSIYCNFCGYPLYMEGADETEGPAEDEIDPSEMKHPTPAIESPYKEEQEDDYEEIKQASEDRARTKETLDRILAIFKGSNKKNDN